MIPNVSFEFFPPRSLEASFNLWDSLQSLNCFGPEFVSITYGAGGSTRKITMDTLKAVATHMDVEIAGHLTCQGQSRQEVLDVAKGYRDLGIKRIVALRGDAVSEDSTNGYATSIELIEALNSIGGFDITVSPAQALDLGSRGATHPDLALHPAMGPLMLRKRSRSKSGTCGSSARAATRSLKYALQMSATKPCQRCLVSTERGGTAQ